MFVSQMRFCRLLFRKLDLRVTITSGSRIQNLNKRKTHRIVKIHRTMGLSRDDASRNEIKNILVIICIRIGRYERGTVRVRRAKPVADRLANNMNQRSYVTQAKFTLNAPQPFENFYERSCRLLLTCCPLLQPTCRTDTR